MLAHLASSRPTSRFRRLATAMAFVSIALTAACGSDGDGGTAPPPAPSDVSGNYSLVKVRTLGNLQGGGDALPVTFTDGGGSTLTFASGSLVLRADGSFDLSVDASFNGGSVTMTDYGTYSATGGSIEFHSQKSAPRLSTGTVSGSALTANSQFAGIPFEIQLTKGG